MFNKKIVSDLSLESPYDLVKSGEWTIDKFASMSRGISADLDGDGELDENDRYGFACNLYGSDCFLFGSDYSISKKKRMISRRSTLFPSHSSTASQRPSRY